jgi:O-antigen/teichoic acid export membrane protein
LGRAQGIVGLFYRTIVEGLLPVLLSHFAQSHREQKDIGTQILGTLGNVSAVVFPVFACLFIVMDSAIMLLYGSQWESSIEPARILCIGTSLISIAVVINAALAGMGEAKHSLRSNLIGQPTKLALVLVASSYSISHVATAMTFGDLLVFAYMLWASKKTTNFKWKAFIHCMALSGFIAACAAGACLLFKFAAGEMGDGLIVGGCAFSSALGWLLGIALTRHSLGPELVGMIRKR